MDMNPTKRMLITQLEHMICEIVDQKLEERMDLIEASKEFDIGDYTMDINEMISDFINCNVSVEILT